MTTTYAFSQEPAAAAPSGRLFNPATLTLLMIWGAAAALLADRGIFDAPAGTPPLAVLVAALAPPSLFYAAYTMSPALRAWIDSLDIAEVLAAQGWRIVGFAFLAAWGIGALPAVFAAPAGLGDVAVGLAAPAVAIAAARKRTGWRSRAYWLTFAGIADFVAAFATGILSREGNLLHFAGAPASTELGVLPFSLFPSFIVPAFLILHVIALIKLQRA